MNQRLRRVLRGKLIGAAAVVGAVIVVAGMLGTPASAAPSTSSAGSASQAVVVQPAANDAWGCPSGWLCFWVDAGPAGAMGKFQGRNDDWTIFAQSTCKHGNWNDCASAIDNHESRGMWVWENSKLGGGKRCLNAGLRWSNLTTQFFDNGKGMNDAISSDSVGTTSPCP